MIDRTGYAASGASGGLAGARGTFSVSSDVGARPKQLATIAPDGQVVLALPGGGGYGASAMRDPARVLDDVVNGYVSPAAALEQYGLALEYLGDPFDLVRAPERWRLATP
jgi:N-methylhydantoinase B